MGYIRDYFEMTREAFGPNLYNDFMLKYGIEYEIGPKTFAGPRGTPQECFKNATHLAATDQSMTYVEGKVAIFGVCVDHAWCVDADGNLIDPTLTDNDDGRLIGYLGVPFETLYVIRAVHRNGVYGLLDFFHAHKTAPKLFELGLVEGQKWVTDHPDMCRARKRQLRARRGRARQAKALAKAGA